MSFGFLIQLTSKKASHISGYMVWQVLDILCSIIESEMTKARMKVTVASMENEKEGEEINDDEFVFFLPQARDFHIRLHFDASAGSFSFGLT